MGKIMTVILVIIFPFLVLMSGTLNLFFYFSLSFLLVTVIRNLKMQMPTHLQIMPPMIGETLVLYLDPRSTCGQTDLAGNIIGQLPCHSL